ncbi:tripartite tricarboxylate transporter substrate binding protein [Mesobacillus foraminis]|uniref:Bug family tripartite tricarboxylate transporter substrate binding protein n=1 Tax=Mesobacillus foraminis TaxID=279826 RepID=UPI001BECBFE4|nr:tripartite tricarboxylate transporter substrate binding protein [Mesobacillus foraminis]MBT2757852.1 tripartite tricarboxylate transporter substrate binding protein [Mesobacillus foraminis]
MKKKALFFPLAAAVLAMGLAGCGSQATGEKKAGAKSNYPTKAITMVVPFAPGGTTDSAARALAGVANKYLPNEQTVAIVNKDGGAGTIGMNDVVQAKPDGYTIGMATSGPITIKTHSKEVAYKPEDFKPIIQVVATPNVLVVKSDSPIKTYEDWMEYVEKNPNKFTYGTSGAGLTQHITMENLMTKTGVKVKHVPFKGGAPALTALLGGNLEGALVQTPEAIPHIEEGTLRPIWISGTFKPEELKDVPLLTEKGVDVEPDVWTGLMAPSKVPDDVIKVLHDSFQKALEDPAVIEQFKKIGTEPVYKSSDEFQKTIDNDYKENGKVLETIGLK